MNAFIVGLSFKARLDDEPEPRNRNVRRMFLSAKGATDNVVQGIQALTWRTRWIFQPYPLTGFPMERQRISVLDRYSSHRTVGTNRSRYKLGSGWATTLPILALTDWHAGQSKAGTIVESRADKPVFGLRPDIGLPVIILDPKGTSIGYDIAVRQSGLIGLGRGGLFLMSKAPQPGFRSSTYSYAIDPVTWHRAEIPRGGDPEAWISDWSIRVPLSKTDAFVIAIDRAKADAGGNR